MLSLLHRGGNWGLERWNDLPSTIGQIRVRAGSNKGRPDSACAFPPLYHVDVKLPVKYKVCD